MPGSNLKTITYILSSMDTQNYKRTLAGSVGAGMGALMGASGRTYFILEHKTPSKYHQAARPATANTKTIPIIVNAVL